MCNSFSHENLGHTYSPWASDVPTKKGWRRGIDAPGMHQCSRLSRLWSEGILDSREAHHAVYAMCVWRRMRIVCQTRAVRVLDLKLAQPDGPRARSLLCGSESYFKRTHSQHSGQLGQNGWETWRKAEIQYPGLRACGYFTLDPGAAGWPAGKL